MSKRRHLMTIAGQGFADMGPALRSAFNNRSDDDELAWVYGPRPRAAVLALTIGALAAGVLPPYLAPDYVIIHKYVNWPAVFVSAAFAFVIRRYLFASGKAAEGDFAWLAASTIPAVAAVMLIAVVARFANGDYELLPGAPIWTAFGGVLVILAQAVGVVAGMTIALAALCYSRNWPHALAKLAGQLFALKLLMAIMFFIMLEIGITERIVSAILDAAFGIRLPDWLGEFADQLTYTAVSVAIYLAIIGATWTVCRRSFGRLLESGEVDIIDTVKDMVDPDGEAKRAKKARKAARKQAKKEKREAGK